MANARQYQWLLYIWAFVKKKIEHVKDGMYLCFVGTQAIERKSNLIKLNCYFYYDFKLQKQNAAALALSCDQMFSNVQLSLSHFWGVLCEKLTIYYIDYQQFYCVMCYFV